MAYTLVANNRGGLHIKDEDTLAHAELHGYEREDGSFCPPDEQAKEWMAQQDKAKQDAWDAANARPEDGERPATVPPVSRIN